MRQKSVHNRVSKYLKMWTYFLMFSIDPQILAKGVFLHG